MKVLANGGLNLSELDGWWAEAYSPEVGWALGDGKDRGEDPDWDAAEAEELYTLLEQQVIPGFYDRDQRGIPQRWVARMRESMARLTPAFSANRAVRQYTEEHYIPLASAYSSRAADGGRAAAASESCKREIASQWQDLRFGPVAVDHHDGNYSYSVQVQLGRIEPDDVQIELYADSLNSDAPFRSAMKLDRAVPGAAGVYQYSGAAPSSRPAGDYTLRAVPQCPQVLTPIELSLITWQK
jgi:starch phosphorylase